MARHDVGWVVASASLIVVTLAGIVAGDGSLVPALAPGIVFILGYLVWRLPLIYPSLVLAFLALTLENPSDAPACGVWQSPLYGFGAIVLAHLNLSFPNKALIFSGMDLLLLYVFVVAYVRRVTRSKSAAPRLRVARPMGVLAATCLGAAAWLWIHGVFREDFDFASSLWQVQRVVYLPVVFFLFQRSIRGLADVLALGRLIVAAACVKAVVALYVRSTVPPPVGETVLAYATTHADSMLFSVAVCIVAVPLLEKHTPKRLCLSLVLLSALIAGILANTRRLAWVEVGIGLSTAFFASRWTAAKRNLSRVVVLLAPVVVAYVAVGWDSHGGLFRPVEILQSVVDSKANPSTEWRDWENYDLFYTIRQVPVLGTGYGHGFTEIVRLPDISRAYALYRFIPHNSILGLLAYGGVVGFTGLWAMLVGGVYLAARAHRLAMEPDERAASLVVQSTVAIYLAHCYGDMGLGTWTSVFIVAPALATVATLAVSTGAWPALVHRAPVGERVRGVDIRTLAPGRARA